MTAKTSAEVARAWRDRHPGLNAERGREWRERNPGKTTERVRAWREANPEPARVLRLKQRANEKRYRAANKERIRESLRIYNQKVRYAAIEAEKLLRGVCLDCGLTVTTDNLCVFDFDHRDPSAKRSVVSRTAPSRLAEEMAKCDLRCANCHRLKTYRNKDGRKPSIVIVQSLETLF